jgi:hypothetical protein
VSYWEKIEHPRFYGRVQEAEIARQMPEDIAPLAYYLVRKHGMAITGIYLENYKSPERVVVMDRTLPLDELQAAFPPTHGLRYTDWGVISDVTFSQLVGPQG